MDGVLIILLAVGVWLLLQLIVLPRLGFST